MSRCGSILTRLCPVFFLLFVSMAMAQNFRGGIAGIVLDATGAVVANAKVSVRAIGTSAQYEVASSSAGDFLIAALPVGQYTVVVSQPGFDSAQFNNVPVVAGGTYTLNVKLSAAQLTTTVQVSADQLSLETSEATLSTVLPDKAMQDLPQNGRDFTVLVGQSAGFSGYAITGGGGTGAVNGTRANQINYQIEGTDNNDIWWNVSAVNQSAASSIAGTLMPEDAINEFSFVTSADTESGRNSGGTVNVVIKSGSNALHGSSYYFNRNEAFAANSPFAPSGSRKNEERNENLGGSLGGPIRKDRLFFFGAYEYQNFIIGNSTNATEPSTAYQAAAQSVLSYYGMTPNPVSVAMLNAYWPSNSLTGAAAAGNYYSNAPETGTSYNGIVKLDGNISDRSHISFKWFEAYGKQVAADGSNLAWYFQKTPLHVQNYSLIFDTVFTPHLTNQASMGVNYFDIAFSDAHATADPSSLGLDTGVTDSSLGGAPKLVLGPPPSGQALTASSSGFDIVGPLSPVGRQDITWHMDDSLSYVVGEHQLHFGGEFRRARVNDGYESNGRGVLNFDGSQGPWNYPSSSSATSCDNLATSNLGNYAPGYSPSDNFDGNVLILADFMAGCISNANIVEGSPKRLVFLDSWSAFAQDSWKLSRKLNLSYGLHYDYYGPMHDGDKDLSVFNPNAPQGLAVAGTDISTIYDNYWTGLAPRVGFAFQPKENGRIVFRGGMGLFYDSPYLIPFLNLHGTTNGGAVGVQDNPAGSKPVASPTISGSVIGAGHPIFPSLQDAVAGAGVISVFSVDPKYRPSFTSIVHLNMQVSLGSAAMAQIGYVGSFSRHLTDVVDINQAAQGSAFDAPTCAAIYADAGTGNQQCSRPYFSKFPDYSVINQVQSGENANYNSLQAFIKTQAWHGITTQVNYTWSHALDYETGLIPYLPQDSTNLKAEYGNSDFDTRNAVSGFLLYDIPSSSHGPKWATQGWQVNTGLYFHSGQPFTVLASTNTSGNGEYADRADATGIDPFKGVSHSISDGLVQWFNPAAFADPAPGSYGTTRRGQYTNPGFSDVDFSVIRNMTIREKLHLQIRAEMFNIFNHINLAPVGAPGAGDQGGAINSTIGAYYATPGIGQGEPFSTQLAAKITF
jgi:hypothetical protein